MVQNQQGRPGGGEIAALTAELKHSGGGAVIPSLIFGATLVALIVSLDWKVGTRSAVAMPAVLEASAGRMLQVHLSSAFKDAESYAAGAVAHLCSAKVRLHMKRCNFPRTTWT